MSLWQPTPRPEPETTTEAPLVDDVEAQGHLDADEALGDDDGDEGLDDSSDSVRDDEALAAAGDVEPAGYQAIEPVVLTPQNEGLPTMAQLDRFSAELDEIDAALAWMDAEPGLPARPSA